MDQRAGMVWTNREVGCAGDSWRKCPEICAQVEKKQGVMLQLVPEKVFCQTGTGTCVQAGQEECFHPGFAPSCPHHRQGCGACSTLLSLSEACFVLKPSL